MLTWLLALFGLAPHPRIINVRTEWIDLQDCYMHIDWSDGTSGVYYGYHTSWWAYPSGWSCPMWMDNAIAEQYRRARWARDLPPPNDA